jgi:hypothetical protein
VSLVLAQDAIYWTDLLRAYPNTPAVRNATIAN